MNNTDNPYTLTLLTRPVEEYNYLTKTHDRGISNREVNSGKYYDKSKVKSSSPNNESGSNSDNNLELERTSESAFRRKVTDTRINDDYDIPIYTNPASKTRGSSRTTVEMTSPLSVTAFVASTTPMPRSTPTSVITNSLSPTTKYYLKTISRRPTTITSQKQKKKISTENIVNTETLITSLENGRDNFVNSNYTSTEESPEWDKHDRYRDVTNNPTVSPYRTLDNLRRKYKNNFVQDYTTGTTTTTTPLTTTTIFTTPFTTSTSKQKYKHNTKKHTNSPTDLSYYTYHVEDDVIPEQTTEIFSGKVKHVIQAFFNNLITTPAQLSVQEFSSTTPVAMTIQENEKVVNIGYRNKNFRDTYNKPLEDQNKFTKIIQESNVNSLKTPNVRTVDFPITDTNNNQHLLSSTLSIPLTNDPTFTLPVTARNIPSHVDSSKGETGNLRIKDLSTSKFSDFIQDISEDIIEDVDIEKPQSKFQNLFNEELSSQPISNENVGSDILTSTKSVAEAVTPLSLDTWHTTMNESTDVASTTSTTKSTTTERLESTTKISTTTTSKSISFPTRPSRVNPAIKLAATNLGGGRRSYQSSSKCSTDNSLQANPKCNEIKYQRYINRRPVV